MEHAEHATYYIIIVHAHIDSRGRTLTIYLFMARGYTITNWVQRPPPKICYLRFGIFMDNISSLEKA